MTRISAPPPVPAVPLDRVLPAIPERGDAVGDDVARFAAARGASTPTVRAAALAVAAAWGNAVAHAERADGRHGQIWVTARVERDRLRVCLRDDGDGQGPGFHSPGLDTGLPIASALAESLEVRPGDAGRGTEIHLSFVL